MIDRYKHQQLQIGLVSPQQISAWANKTLPNGEIVGEVTEIEHVEWETNKPKIGGFFCERIFGPIKSGICACGHYGEFGDQKEKRTFCGDCGVEFANSRIRRYQMGYIKLACPVTHVWYLRRLPSYIANLLDKPLKELEDLVYCDVMGLAKHFIRTNVEPEWMVLCLLPVLPPGLRPAVQIGELKRMGSDINDLYGRVLSRNNDLLDLLTIQSTPGDVVMSQERLVQEAVDTLLDNGIRGEPIRDGHNKVYKSFTDLIEGKEGRFRETLLGKRVDYSGRSVIVVGPSLSLHQCGLPREIAIELFQTFLLRGLIRQHLAPNLGTAKSQIREKERIVWEILQEVMKGHPVLLNRAPTLHRLGIQAFQPILVEGRAICLHPLVCKGFNADFDGDQMAVHVPLSLEAQAEARLLMFSYMNLLAPSIGDPICVPTQDMLIGLYILTSGNRRGLCINRYNLWNPRNCQTETERIDDNNSRYMKGKEPLFCNSYDAIGAYRQKRIHLDSPFWLRWRLDQRLIVSRGVPVEVHYESLGTHHEIYGHFLIVRSVKNEILCIYIRTTLGHILLYREIEEAIQGFYQVSSYGT
uniref:DNA-directed RNA polymerase subunit n=1 Tax=Geranium sibiricum TaxID=345237 RepID=A0A7T4XAT9_9ROSI|nr:RNA polymerase beta' subunit [Geranium sibiricum]QQD90262.1 RNA polymerase beta' subunit [Geranium sibiricum]